MVWGFNIALMAGIARSFLLFIIFEVLALLFLVFFRKEKWRLALFYILGSVLFFFYGLFSTRGFEERIATADLAATAGGGSRVEKIAGWVSSFPQWSSGGYRFVFTARLRGRKCKLLAITRAPGVAYGDSLLLAPRWVALKGSRGRRSISRKLYLFGHGVAGVLRADQDRVDLVGGKSGSRLARDLFWPLHRSLRSELLRNLGSDSGVPLALVLGERGFLDRKVKRSFVRLGISHLLALSGLHLGFVFCAVLLFLRAFRVRSKWPVLVVLAVYVGTVGEVVSLHRAYTMAVLLVLASSIRRPIRPFHTLGDALLILLLSRPHALYAIGFQLTFLSTAAVLLAVEQRSIKPVYGILGKTRDYVFSGIKMSFYAQLFVLPLVLLYFAQASIVSPLATILFLPPVAAIMFFSAFCSVFSVVFPGAGPALFSLLGGATRTLCSFLFFASRLSPPLVSIEPPVLWLYYLGIAAIFLQGAPRWQKLAGWTMLAVSFLWSFQG